MEPVTVYRQDRIRAKLERDLRQGRLAPSLIFYGLSGLGKERMAFHLAQSILCREAKAAACGECLSCRKVVKLLHPDVQWLFPRPGTSEDEEMEGILERMSKEDFYRPAFGKATSHPIDAIRQLRTVSGKHPYEGDAKVFIVAEGDRMTVEAANAFLKLLEEPPDDTYIVITTSRLHALLPTIRSRCEEIRFSPLPLEILRDVLVREIGLPAERADELSRSSEGSLGKAIQFHRSGVDGWGDAWQLFELAVRGEESDRYAYVVENPMKNDRERIQMALETLTGLLRDLVVVSLDIGKREVIHLHRYEQLGAYRELPVEGLVRSIRLIEEQARLLDRNINSSILLWRLLHGLTETLSVSMESER